MLFLGKVLIWYLLTMLTALIIVLSVIMKVWFLVKQLKMKVWNWQLIIMEHWVFLISRSIKFLKICLSLKTLVILEMNISISNLKIPKQFFLLTVLLNFQLLLTEQKLRKFSLNKCWWFLNLLTNYWMRNKKRFWNSVIVMLVVLINFCL